MAAPTRTASLSRDATDQRPARITSRTAGVVGVLASLACTVAMTLPLLGLAGATAAGAMDTMASMDSMGGSGGGLLGWLLTYGPPTLITSVVLVVVSLALRRPLAAVPALAFGALLYWGMYGQPSSSVMYLALALAYAGWIGAYLWTRRSLPTRLTHDDNPPSPRRDGSDSMATSGPSSVPSLKFWP